MRPDSSPLGPERTRRVDLTRRGLLRRGLFGGLGIGLFGGPIAVAAPTRSGGGADSYGPLQAADGNGLRLPPGFTSRVVATSGQVVGSTGHVWHQDPDGGATFATGDGGWVYVSNSERSNGLGGVGAIRFTASGAILDAYSILQGTSRNCAGGPTPWGTWLSCEEVALGEVWECDPLAPGSQGVVRPWMGKLNHEAAAVDPVRGVVYLTEDRINGLLYRFTPATYPDLSTGVLEAAEILGAGAIVPGQVRSLAWHPIPDPTLMGTTPVNLQAPSATPFNGGEGCWYEAGQVWFSTKGDNRVWRLDSAADQLSIEYDLATTTMPELSGVDNVHVTACGDVFVAEDGGDLQIVALTTGGDVKPVIQLVGVTGTEITGPALSPDGTRLYFSSQRNPGRTYEVTGPFLGPTPVPAMGALAGTLLAAAVASAGVARLRAAAAGPERG